MTDKESLKHIEFIESLLRKLRLGSIQFLRQEMESSLDYRGSSKRQIADLFDLLQTNVIRLGNWYRDKIKDDND